MPQFEVTGWFKSSEEDTWENGCLPESGTSIGGRDRFVSDTLEGIVSKCMAFACVDSQDAITRDACEHVGRLDVAVTETAEGFEATPAQIEQWKDGKLRLWYCVYTFIVEQVERTPVSIA